jgi:outer membrane protein TolC
MRLEQAKEYHEIIEDIDTNQVYTLQECINVGMSHNYDLYSQSLLATIKDEEAIREYFKALPDLTLGANYTQRDNSPGATSIGVQDGMESLRASRARNKHSFDFTVGSAISTLDMGLSMVHGQTNEQEAIIERLRLMKAERDFHFEITQAYFAVAASQSFIDKIESKMTEYKTLLKKIENGEGGISRIDQLSYKQKFIDRQKDFSAAKRSYNNFCYNLTSLMGFNPSNEIQVDTSFIDNSKGSFKLPYPVASLPALEKITLNYREELKEGDIKIILEDLKKDAEFLLLFPNVNLFADFNKSTNNYLYNSNWFSAGIGALVNLTKIPEVMQSMDIADLHKKRLRYKNFATCIALISQTRIAYANLIENESRVIFNEERFDVDVERLDLIKKAVKIGSLNKLAELDAGLDHSYSWEDKAISISDYMIAYHRLMSTTGLTNYIFEDKELAVILGHDPEYKTDIQKVRAYPITHDPFDVFKLPVR